MGKGRRFATDAAGGTSETARFPPAGFGSVGRTARTDSSNRSAGWTGGTLSATLSPVFHLNTEGTRHEANFPSNGLAERRGHPPSCIPTRAGAVGGSRTTPAPHRRLRRFLARRGACPNWDRAVPSWRAGLLRGVHRKRQAVDQRRRRRKGPCLGTALRQGTPQLGHHPSASLLRQLAVGTTLVLFPRTRTTAVAGIAGRDGPRLPAARQGGAPRPY